MKRITGRMVAYAVYMVVGCFGKVGRENNNGAALIVSVVRWLAPIVMEFG